MNSCSKLEGQKGSGTVCIREDDDGDDDVVAVAPSSSSFSLLVCDWGGVGDMVLLLCQ